MKLSVAFVLYPRVLHGSITLPLEMLTAADHFDRVRHKSESRLQLHVATADGKPLASTGILSIQPTSSLDQLTDIDLLYLPTLWRNPLPVLHRQRHLLSFLQGMASRQALICAVGTGSCFLAEAGLLNGKPATTHWYFMETFSRLYPGVELKRQHLITRAGNLYCAGSVNAVADLTCYFIEHFYGPQIARQVESHFSPEIRRSYRQQGYFEGEVNLQHHDELMIDAQQWLHEHFADPLSFADVARQLGMSQRTLNRRFKLATGMSPGRYLQQLRLDQARELLRDSNLPIAEIAVSVGYQDIGYFSTLFRAQMAQSPTEYRQAVRGKLFAVNLDTQQGNRL